MFQTSLSFRNLGDLHALIGVSNVALFKDCVNRLIKDKYQVVEEFICPLPDHQTFQHVQMLFDPIFDNQSDQIIGINGYCRDNGRTFKSNQEVVKWYDVEWLSDFPIFTLEWIVHSDGNCEIIFSPFHKGKVDEDYDQFIVGLNRTIKDLIVGSESISTIKTCIEFSYLKYQYQLLASKCELNSLLWRGFSGD